ncbi:MAG TPA: LuxR C-terminal-related transcriptional regulator [Allosphingosinicella sp.]|nr:LuxR C-terminal-related transcriptional regulator [Allosphingosinicella sp.]
MSYISSTVRDPTHLDSKAASGRFVYIVDEDSVHRRLTFRFLSAHAFSPRAFACAEDFFDNLPDLAPGCVLLGKVGSGHETLAVVERLSPRIAEFPAIVTAFNGDLAAAVRAMRLGASDVLESPFDRSSLPAMLGLIFVALDQRLAKLMSLRHARALLQSLTAREGEVLSCLVLGLGNKAVAQRLGLSLRTVEMHRKNMMNRLQVSHLSDALRLAFTADWPNPPGPDV